MPLELPLSRFAADLHHDVANLSGSGRAHRMAFRLEPAAGVHRTRTFQRRAALLDVRSAFALLHESEILRRHDFGYGEAIVHFGELNVARRHARHLVCLPRGLRHRAKRGDVVLFIERHVIGGLRDAQHLRTGFEVNSAARSSGAISTAAAPSLIREQS